MIRLIRPYAGWSSETFQPILDAPASSRGRKGYDCFVSESASLGQSMPKWVQRKIRTGATNPNHLDVVLNPRKALKKKTSVHGWWRGYAISSRISKCTVPTWVLNCPWRTCQQNNSRSCFSWLLALSSLTLGVADTICWPHVASNLPREAWQAMPMVEPIWHTVSQSLGLASWSTHYLHLQCQWSFKWGQAHHGTPIMKHMKL